MIKWFASITYLMKQVQFILYEDTHQCPNTKQND